MIEAFVNGFYAGIWGLGAMILPLTALTVIGKFLPKRRVTPMQSAIDQFTAANPKMAAFINGGKVPPPAQGIKQNQPFPPPRAP